VAHHFRAVFAEWHNSEGGNDFWLRRVSISKSDLSEKLLPGVHLATENQCVLRFLYKNAGSVR